MADRHAGKPRASRASKPKVRTGCLRCRDRHLKCDEAKPACLRCMKSRLNCSYWSRKATETEICCSTRQLIPKISLIPGGFRTSYPSALIPGETGVEHRYFCHFQENTAFDLAGSFDEILWTKLMLQACQHEPFIRHAVVAIGALDRSRISSAASRRSNIGSAKDLHREFALLQYNKALNAMKDSIRESEIGTNPRKVILACLLVVCLENFFRNKYLALSHALAGHRILQDWLSRYPSSLQHKPGISSPAVNVIEDELVHAFGKLDLQISSKYDPRPLHEHLLSKQYGSRTIGLIPSAFSTLKEAKVFLDLVMRRTQHFISCALITSNSSALSRPFVLVPPTDTFVAVGTNMHSTTNIVTDEIRSEQIVYAAEIERWSRAFQPLFRKLQSTCDKATRDALYLLRIHYLAIKIIIAAVIFDDEMAYDQFEPEFKEMMQLIKLSRQDKHCWIRGMSFELGLASPLFLVATRCRNRILRREAISTLRSLPDEGSWYPDLVAILAAWIMEVEEGGLASEVIPCTSRAVISRISDVSNKGRVALFQCVQRKGGPDGGPIWKEKLVYW
ncbi:hypothetical protein N431DRAFT_360988 [Stipitochalara longipes BDJ]|nr:hypothetical protein N431DRAFT_360988 [Stipitochalara longipes BDJ]